ncbi:hypothetical protein F4811DRAFT_524063 [Daldinia bambusicola]|nr:hypothetical protein F4811DRAFT_524063 [Daldinia bambusicola]
MKKGLFRKDPKGNHLTVSHKNAEQVLQKAHVTSHGYVPSKSRYELVEATHSKMKPDSTPKFRGGPVWPVRKTHLDTLKIGHSHRKS